MQNDRKIWVTALDIIAYPVISALAQGKLSETLPREFHGDRSAFAPLEAFGRTMCGIAPWLEAENLDAKEKALQDEYIDLVTKALENGTDKNSPDALNFDQNGSQPLVDTAFLAHAIVRAPRVLFKNQKETTQKNIIDSLKRSRVIKPCNNNWLLFSAMVETALYTVGSDYNKEPIDFAINKFMDGWYVGDGIYGDGDNFHFDYYNSFVIQPMLLDILKTFRYTDDRYSELYEKEVKRASRYAAVLEQMICQDGTYTVIGRSSTYRFGAFQLLSQAAKDKFLPKNLTPGSVRSALTAVIEKCMENEDMFDSEGFLQPGIYGHQPSMAEGYINTGSLYLATFVFIALGLSPDDDFWTSPYESWTSKKIWAGKDVTRDHAQD